jgi:4-hydroxy-tetrahydrodipicolinate synthase
VRIYEYFMADDIGAAWEVYRKILPAITFIMQSIENFICYGKRIFALRAGLDVEDRAPALRPTAFGLSRAAEHAASLGPL